LGSSGAHSPPAFARDECGNDARVQAQKFLLLSTTRAAATTLASRPRIVTKLSINQSIRLADRWCRRNYPAEYHRQPAPRRDLSRRGRTFADIIVADVDKLSFCDSTLWKFIQQEQGDWGNIGEKKPENGHGGRGPPAEKPRSYW
jgi:hypothetical protein